jgi:ATP synthase protein I
MDKKKTNRNPLPKPSQGELGSYMSLAYQLGFTLVASVVIFCFLGYWLDRWLHTSPIFFISGILLGSWGGLYFIYKETQRFMGKK